MLLSSCSCSIPACSCSCSSTSCFLMFVVGKGIGPPLSKASLQPGQPVAIAHIPKPVAIAQHLEKLSQLRSVSQSRAPRKLSQSRSVWKSCRNCAVCRNRALREPAQSRTSRTRAIAQHLALAMQSNIPDEQSPGVLVRRRVIGHISVGQPGRVAA